MVSGCVEDGQAVRSRRTLTFAPFGRAEDGVCRGTLLPSAERTCRRGLMMSVHRGLDRKWLGHRRNGANDPHRKSALVQQGPDMLLYTGLKLPPRGLPLTGERVERRLAAVLAADVAGYSRLMGADEVGTLEALKALRREIFDPAIASHKGRIVKTTGDGLLIEFASVVDAVTCAIEVQNHMGSRAANDGSNIAFRIGINIGDVIIEGDDIFGDGVNIAARVESECEPGGVCISGSAFEQVRDKTGFFFDDLGEKLLKNIDRPVRLYAIRPRQSSTAAVMKSALGAKPFPLPDRPSIAVLPFQNLSGDPEQEYFADGMVEDIITALSRFKSLFVIARNSTFIYKGKAIEIKRVGEELGVRYVLEGSVRKVGNRLRITGQLIEAATNSHVWADRFDGEIENVFDLQDQITTKVVGLIAPQIERAEIERVKRKPPADLDSHDYFLRGMALVHKYDFSDETRLFFRKRGSSIQIMPPLTRWMLGYR